MATLADFTIFGGAPTRAMGGSPIPRYKFNMTSIAVVFAGLADAYPHAAMGGVADTSARVGTAKVKLR